MKWVTRGVLQISGMRRILKYRIAHKTKQECGEEESSADYMAQIKRQLDGTRQSAVDGKSAENEFREHRNGVICTSAVVGRSAGTELEQQMQRCKHANGGGRKNELESRNKRAQ